MRTIASTGLIVLLTLTGGLAEAAPPSPGARIIRVDHFNSVVVPARSPVAFRRRTENDEASFSGRFVVTGRFWYACPNDCGKPIAEEDLAFYFVPDAPAADRLPRWTNYQNGRVDIAFENREAAAKALTTAEQRAALRSGRVEEVSGRTTLRLDNLVLGIACDSPYYVARFVEVVDAEPEGEPQAGAVHGCSD